MVKGLPSTPFVFDDIHRYILFDMAYYLVGIICPMVLKFLLAYVMVIMH